MQVLLPMAHCEQFINEGTPSYASENVTGHKSNCQFVVLQYCQLPPPIQSIPLACAECDDSLPFSGAPSIPLCYILFLSLFSTNILPSSLTSPCHLFLGLIVSKVICNTLLGILFSSILCTCPNQRNL
jgi:hypothetical protein